MSADPKVYNKLFTDISQQASDLEDKFESGNFTSRDLAVLGELWSQYINGLDDLFLEGIKVAPRDFIIEVDSQKIKFPERDNALDFIADLMKGGSNATV